MERVLRSTEEKIELMRLIDEDHANGMSRHDAIKKQGLHIGSYYTWKKDEKMGKAGSGRRPGVLNKSKTKPRVLDLLNLGHGGMELEQVKPQAPQKQMMLIVGTKDELLQFAKELQ